MNWLVLLLVIPPAILWVTAFRLKRKLKREGQRSAAFYRRVYVCWAFTVASGVLILARLTGSQS